MQYSCFLRAVNVGGKTIKMDRLRDILSSLKLKNVKTYIQSGNVQFDSSEREEKLVSTIEARLAMELGYEVNAFLRTADEMGSIVSNSLFKKLSKGEKGYIAFLHRPLPKTKFPLFSPNKDVELLGSTGREVYCRSHEVKGKWGFPNAFIEKTFKVRATTRNPATVLAMASPLP